MEAYFNELENLLQMANNDPGLGSIFSPPIDKNETNFQQYLIPILLLGLGKGRLFGIPGMGMAGDLGMTFPKCLYFH